MIILLGLFDTCFYKWLQSDHTIMHRVTDAQRCYCLDWKKQTVPLYRTVSLHVTTKHTHTLYHVFYFSAQIISWSTLDRGPNRLNALGTSPKIACSTELSPKARNHRRRVPHRSQCRLQYLTPSQTETVKQNLIQDPGLWNIHSRALQVSWSKKSNSTLKKWNNLSLWRDTLRGEVLSTLTMHCMFSSCPGITGLRQMFTHEEAQLSFQAMYIQKTC